MNFERSTFGIAFDLVPIASLVTCKHGTLKEKAKLTKASSNDRAVQQCRSMDRDGNVK